MKNFIIDADREDGNIEESQCRRRLGDIVLEEEVGRGAFAIVYKGYNKSGQEFAVKEIPKSLLNEKLLTSLQKEVSILSTLNCEHIVRLYNVVTTAKHFNLVMEFCNGGDLRKKFKFLIRVEESVAQKVIYQVSQGLKVLYQNRIIHRDLKLSNLLLVYDKDGTYKVKIADFGFATILTRDQDAQTFCGTAPNMAPEVLEG
jgi:serine/threonine-protein kinase ULK/ATG1